jgi:tetratricopeptide (TPR) repeat protein
MTERIAGRQAPSGPRRDAFSIAVADLAKLRPLQNPILQQIALSLQNNRVEFASRELVNYLSKYPDDPAALYLAAQLENRFHRPAKAAVTLARCLELAPDYFAARFAYASTLYTLHEFVAALSETERLLTEDADNPLFLQLKAGLLDKIGEGAGALAIWERLTAQYPAQEESWRRYGDALRALGFLEKAATAYRKAIDCRPSFGQAWWNLASLRVFQFSDADIAAMHEQLQRPDLAVEDRIDLLFALGRAYEDLRVYEKSYSHYAKANAAKRLQRSESAQAPASGVAEKVRVFTPAFLHGRSGGGFPTPDPIFVVGRPRSGSTLLEQILSSHSAIEGTGELPYIVGLAAQLRERRKSADGAGYDQLLERLDASEFRALGEEYLKKAQSHRKLGRQLFVDKTPNNYHHLGLIRLILPNAKIIDVRRNPAANCFSIFKLNYATLKLNYRGVNLNLSELGRVYCDYVELMAHFDRVLPGWVHRVIYERLVADPETEIRNLLDYLGLPFEDSCLHFYQTERAVRTPSAGQVRRAISGEEVDQWRNFEPWLAPLLASLGAVFTEYPAVPREFH